MATLSSLWNDIRSGFRAFSSRPAFAGAVVLTIGIGVGVNVAIFSLFEQSE